VNRWTKIVLGIVLGFAVLTGLGYGFRGEIATRVFAVAVDAREGVRCSHPRLEIGSALETVEMAPIECSFSRGPVASAQTFTPTKITLKGFGAKQVHVARAVMNFRERDVSKIPSNTLEDIANITGMRDQLIKAVLDASDMYSSDAPTVSVDQLTILRERKRESVIHDFVMTQDGPWNRSQGSKVEVGLDGVASLRNFDRRVTATRGSLKIDIHLGDADPGDKPDFQLRLEGTDLDRSDSGARFELSLHDPDDSRAQRTPQSERAMRSAERRKGP
jgi:hypothetical protein